MLKPDITVLLFDDEIGAGRKFIIKRRRLTKHKGRYSDTPESEQTETIEAVGSVQPAGVDALQQLPEADRSGKVIIVRSTTPIQMGKAGTDYDLMADIIEYQGEQYKVLQVKDWAKWGMYVAYATRTGEVS